MSFEDLVEPTNVKKGFSRRVLQLIHDNVADELTPDDVQISDKIHACFGCEWCLFP